MRYGESAFDILYLLFAVIAGVLLVRKSRTASGVLAGCAALILGTGDAFHLVPRVINYFAAGDMTAWLGFGKLVTSVTMALFYLLLYELWRRHYERTGTKGLTAAVDILTGLRILLCLFPQNGWLTGGGSVLWAVLRNAPLAAVGVITVVLWYRTRKETRAFSLVWLYVTLSYLFYIPVAVGASLVPILGMLMLPKTICYILIIAAFLRYFCGKKADA